MSESHLSNVWFKATDLEFVRGLGTIVYTAAGEEYLDFMAGIAVASTGHCHPLVTKAISDQAGEFIHAQVNCYRHPLLETLARRLFDITPNGIDTFFYANSGAEITEAAVKLAKQATGRANTIVFQGSFHGRTHQTMAMTTSKSVYRAGHAPLPAGIFPSPFPSPLAPDLEQESDRALSSLRELLATQSSPTETACMIMEPVLGEGGYIPAPERFLRGVVEICKEHGILFIADEVQSGFGRTGRWFTIDHYGIEPDILCMAKGIASGFPFSALGTRRELDDRWPQGSHGGTYGGNPMGCAAALATIDVLGKNGFLETVQDRGRQLRAGLEGIAASTEHIVDVRGLGLMLAFEFDSADRTARVIKLCREDSRVLLMSAGHKGTTIRLMPPLTVSSSEIDRALEAIRKAVVQAA